jgi:hypothetical protein
MAIQFGIGTLLAGPHGAEMEFGCVQNTSIDFSFDRAQLYCGSALYAKDVRVHTATISGKAAFAEIDGEAFYKLLGGDSYVAGDSNITISQTTSPSAFRMRLIKTTDTTTMILTLLQVRTDSLSISMERTNHIIPDFGFTAFADASGNVATFDLGDPS